MDADQYLIDFESDKRERLALVRCLERVAVNMPGGRWACVVELLERLLILSTDTRPDHDGRILTRCQVCVIGSNVTGRRMRDSRTVRRWCSDAIALGLLEVRYTSQFTGGPSWNEYRIVWPMVRAMLSPGWQPVPIQPSASSPNVASSDRVGESLRDSQNRQSGIGANANAFLPGDASRREATTLGRSRADTGGHGRTRADIVSAPNNPKSNTLTSYSNLETTLSSSYLRRPDTKSEGQEVEEAVGSDFDFGSHRGSDFERSAPLGSIGGRAPLGHGSAAPQAPLGSRSDSERLQELVAAFGAAGVYDADAMVPPAVERVGLDHVEAVLAHFHANPGAWHGGGLRTRLTRCRVWTAPQSGWPPAMRPERSVAAVSAPKPPKSIEAERSAYFRAKAEARAAAAESEDLGAQLRAAMAAKRGGS